METVATAEKPSLEIQNARTTVAGWIAKGMGTIFISKGLGLCNEKTSEHVDAQ